MRLDRKKQRQTSSERRLCPVCDEVRVVTEADPHAFGGEPHEMTYCRGCGTIFGPYIAPRGPKEPRRMLEGSSLTVDVAS